MTKANILVVEDDNLLRNLLLESISMEGHNVRVAESSEKAVELLEGEKFDILLTDVNLPGKNGLELLPTAFQHNSDLYALVMTGFGTIDTAVQAMKLGAADFLSKPIALNDLLSAIRLAVEKIENISASPKKTSPLADSPIIAESSMMLKLLEEVKTIAPYKLNSLITGETGTGKELIARAIHAESPRRTREFVALNCAAVPEQLLEDELFGHVKGAFTGAQTDRKGRFEQADGGTLFLDEIGDMNLSLQAKLLRVLQESEFEKLGSSKTVKVDIRIVAATSADLDRKIDDGSFRADLYHRLNAVHLRIPPLRERPDDVLPIAEGLLKRFCEITGLPAKTIADETKQSLKSYGFPGNVRQLQNCMERAAVFSGAGTEIKTEHLPEEIKQQSSSSGSVASFIPRAIPEEGIDFSSVVSQVERELLLQTLNKTGGNKMQAAKLLNMKRTTLVEKIKRLEIEETSDDED
ncbi:MAG: sigma-54 dependent transcriptional regulator [Pyrinomonadaceae bacterium]